MSFYDKMKINYGDLFYKKFTSYLVLEMVRIEEMTNPKIAWERKKIIKIF